MQQPGTTEQLSASTTNTTSPANTEPSATATTLPTTTTTTTTTNSTTEKHVEHHISVQPITSQPGSYHSSPAVTGTNALVGGGSKKPQESPLPSPIISREHMINSASGSPVQQHQTTPPPAQQQPPPSSVQQHVAPTPTTTPPTTPESLTVMINKFLTKIVGDSSKKQQNIKDEVKIILEYLKANPALLSKTESSPIASRNNAAWLKVLEHLSIVFKYALESKQSKLIQSSVDITEKLISGNYILYNMVDSSSNKLIIDKFIEPTFHQCVEISDEMTLAQVIKLVHIAATKFHRETLLYSFKTLFYIHVHSKHQSNIFIASKTSITQIIHRLFKNFKSHKPPTPVSPPNNHSNTTPTITTTTTTTPASSSVSAKSTTTTTNTSNTITEELVGSNELVNGIVEDLVDKVIQQQDGNNNNNNSLPNITQTILSPPTITTTPQTSQDSIGSPTTTNINDRENELCLRDSIYLFRLLCGLSLREIIDHESADVRVRIFSLELISSIFEEFGKFLKSYPTIANYEIKEGLFPSILNSGFSTNSTIFKLSLTLFLHLATHFREYLRDAIGQYFTWVILRVLESNTSTLQQKWMVLQVLTQFCQNSQILVDLYVNYDCSLSTKDIFQKTVEDLSKIAQLVVPDNKPHELKVKYSALECLALLVKSLSDGLNLQKENLQEKLLQIPDDTKFIQQKKFKLLIEEGKSKFKMSSKKGVEFFIKIGAVKRDAAELSKFFKETEGLDKVALGVYISEKEDFNLEVLSCFTDLFNFNGFTLDGALRYYLSHFRLVGEAQKVDRIMETFSKKFYTDNSHNEGFHLENSEATFILSFAIVMLATDLHSVSIKKENRMTKAAWLKMNAGNNGGKQFDESYLLAIYDRISQEPLKLKEDIEDTEEIPIKIKTTFPIDDPPQGSAKQSTKPPYDCGNLLENVKFMIGCGWHSILAALSLVLENTEDSKIIQTCLEGFKYSIDLTSLLTMSIEREAFISSLSNFTISEKIKELKQKNMDSLQKLILIARIDGNYLEKSWLQVLRAISLLERLRILFLGVNNPNPQEIMNHLSGSGGGIGGGSGNGSSANSGANSGGLSANGHQPAKRTISTSDFFSVKSLQRYGSTPSIEGINVEQISKELETANHLFVNSNTLSNEAIVYFVECLTTVSMDEIKLQTPSTFSLQKLVEVAVYNSHRIKNIWNIIADHFTKIGTTQADNVYIVSMVIDSLKQLAQKFLDLEEENKDASQKDFLRPLEMIFSHNTHPDVRELILKCIFQLTNGRNSMIKSGWRPIFTIFTLSSSSADHQIASQAFDFVDELIRDFSYITETFFIDYVNCLSSYANSRYKDLSTKAIDILSYCGVQLANGRVCTLLREEGAPSNTPLFTDSEQHISLWFPLLTGLARVISHPDSELRSYSVDTLFRVLALFGSTFSSKLWELIFRGVLLPIFDNVGYSKGQTETILEDTKWLKQTGSHAFQSLTEMFINFIDIICFLLDDMLDLLVSCILQENELLAKTAGTFLIQLVTTNGNKFTQLQWSNIVSQLYKIFQTNTPYEVNDLLNSIEVEDLNIINNNHNVQTQHININVSEVSANSHSNNNNNNNNNNDEEKLLNNKHLSIKNNVSNQSKSAPITPIMTPQDSSPPLSKLTLVNSKSIDSNLNVGELSRAATSLPGTPPLTLTPPSGRKVSNSNEGGNSDEKSSDDITFNGENTNNNHHHNHNHHHHRSQSESFNNNGNNNNVPIRKSFNHTPIQQTPQTNPQQQQQQQPQQQLNINLQPYARVLSNIQSKCSVQLQMVQAINDIAISHYEYLNTSQLLCLGDCLETTFTFCQHTLQDPRLSISLNKIVSTFEIIKKTSITGYLNLLFILYSEQEVDVENRTTQSEFRLINLCKELFQLFISNSSSGASLSSSTSSFTSGYDLVQPSTILQILQGILSFNDAKFIRNMGIFYELLVQLLLNDNRDIRLTLRDILIRVGQHKLLL
ncbi:hypothetical protein CYY_004004 [Polysphondylium violaceum]|uniref:SEC7 domain-containing protein n=1 Tax=Polysphondylium violaceum TaxID=133409 RepID=A0A8J4PWU9_9MYCE|nr:hypothetical protein CYY_004004 [Polysphondylium violaceum]